MRLGSGALAAYGVTGLPLAVLGLPMYVYLPTFYAETVGVSVAAVGATLLIARLFDVFSDPLVGSLSDGWALLGGRRKALMLIGVPLVMIGVAQLFLPVAGANASHLLLWSLLAYLGWTLIAVPYGAWGAELSDEYHERSRIAAARGAFVIVGVVSALLLPLALGISADPSAALKTLAGVLWLALPLAVITTVMFVPERRTGRRRAPWRKGVALLARNRPFLRLISAYLLNGIANGLPATLFLLFVAHVLDARNLSGLLLAVYFGAGVLALPLWVRLAGRTGKHRAWAAAMLIACAVFVWAPFLGPGDVAAFAAICVLSGMTLGADLALPAAIQADVVDLDTRQGGGQRAGLFFGLWGMSTKLSLALAVGIAFPLLELGGFSADGDNAAHSLLMLAVLYAAVPVLFKLGAIALMWHYPLDEAAHAALAGGSHEPPEIYGNVENLRSAADGRSA